MGLDVLTIRCYGCGRSIRIPAARARSDKKACKPTIVFCTSKCNALFVAREGERWKRK